MPTNAAPESPIKPVYNIPDFDEPDPGRSLVASGTVIGASVVVVVVEVVVVVVVEVVVVVVSGACVVAGGTYFFFGATVVVITAVVVVGIATLAIADIPEVFNASGRATYPDGNEV